MRIAREDVARARADAIVDSACGVVRVGAGVDSAVFARGGKELWARRQELGTIAEGTAVAVPAGGELRCRFVVFAVVPPRRSGDEGGGEEILKKCYQAALEAARGAGCQSVAFPLLGAGHRGYPAESALRAALDVLGAEEDAGGLACSLCLYSTVAVGLARSLFGDVEDYLGAHFRSEEGIRQSMEEACDVLETWVEACRPWPDELEAADLAAPSMRYGFRKERAAGGALPPELNRLLETGTGPGVGKALMALMNRKHFDNQRLILKTGISKQLLSKIQNGKHAKAPEKRWLLAFAVALGLTLDEAREFLATAGYAFSRASKTDLVVEYFLGLGHPRIEVVDAALACCGLPTLYPDE
jgi:O-acetyl-ADP-ribose deacetylase (regulator of RNase III)/transcriptional regulator with XRE-family HTH domain